MDKKNLHREADCESLHTGIWLTANTENID